MNRIILLTALLLGCHAEESKPTYKQIVLWDGKPGYAVECPGGSFLECEELKGKLCPQGFNLDHDRDAYHASFTLRCREREILYK